MTEFAVQARGKLNLTLDVLGRRADGYHDMRMVMQSVALADEITLSTGGSGGIAVSTNLRYLPNDERNLAAVAARRLQQATGCAVDGLAIAIKKRIPVCAGMGGGSADAAAVLRGLNTMLKLDWPLEQLAKLGEQVGSDVPYCVMGGTALAEGRGEVLTPLAPLPFCHVVVCKPGFSISTPELFRQIDGVRIRHRPDTAGVVAALEAGDLPGVARRLYNVFEGVLPPRQAATVANIKDILLQHGALGSCMSGTGPTVFGLFAQEDCAHAAWQALLQDNQDTFLTTAVR